MEMLLTELFGYVFKTLLVGKIADPKKWIQSNYQTLLFDRYFCGQNPAYMKQLSQLLALSISAAVTVSLSTNITERLNWLETVFANLSPRVSSRCGDIIALLIQLGP